MRDFTFICAAPSLAPNKICRMWVVLADKQRERGKMKKRKNEGKKEGLKSQSSDRPLAGPRGSHQFCERLHARRAAVRRSRSPSAHPSCSCSPAGPPVRRARARPKSVWSQAMQLLPEDELTQSARVISKTRARSSLNNQRDRERRRRKLC